MTLNRFSSTPAARNHRFDPRPFIRTLPFVAFWILAAALAVSAQSADRLPAGPVPHPDGAVRRLSVSAAVRYLSTYTDRASGGADYQAYHAALAFIPTARITLHTDYTLIDRSQSSHLILGGFDFYFRNPSSSRDAVNADGHVGSPVLRALAGFRIPTDTDSSTIATADLRLTLPAGRRISLAAGYRWREEKSPDDPLDFYGVLSLYFASYPPDSAWANPDGPAGIPSLRLTGGTGEDAWGASVQVLVPLQAELTLTGSLAIDRFRDLAQTRYSAELGFTWYRLR